MGFFNLRFRVFQSVLSGTSLFHPRNITVMRKQPGTPKVHVSLQVNVLYVTEMETESFDSVTMVHGKKCQ